jgi:putative membrane protein
MDVHVLPTVNAVLNGTAALLLARGWYLILHRRIEEHRKTMLAAFTVSSVFLVSYLVYHKAVGAVLFQKQGPIRWVYYAILGTHTILAITVPPLAIVTLFRATKGRFEKHRKLARITMPIWMYVSVTGVIVYLMLYHL